MLMILTMLNKMYVLKKYRDVCVCVRARALQCYF